MTVYEVNNLSEYAMLFDKTLRGESSNLYGDSTPMIGSLNELIEYFDFSSDDIYDENGEFRFDYDDYIQDSFLDIPKTIRVSLLKERIGDIGIDFPFYIVVGGETSWSRVGDSEYRIFYECLPEKV